MNILRFACGAESPPYKGSFPEWVQNEIKSVMSGYALGHRRNDGRYRVIVFDLNGGLKSPRMPDGGGPASCLSCPCAKAAGMKKLNAVPLDPRHGRRIIVTCYPEEVSAPDRSPAERTGLGDATRKVASAGTVRNDRGERP